MDSQTTWYYAACYAIAAAAGLARHLYDGDDRSLRNCFAIGFMSGFVGFGVATIFGGNDVVASGRGPLLLGVSAFCGLAGPAQIKVISSMQKFIFGKFGIEFEEEE